MEQPSPHQSHSILPRWHPLQAAAETVTLETRTVFVTTTCPPPRTIPRPRPPSQTRKLLQARTSMESGTAPAWPPEPSAWTPRAAQQCLAFVWGSRGDPARPLSLEQMALRTIPAPRAHPRPASPPSFPPPRSPSDPRDPLSWNGSEEAQALLAGTKEGGPVLRSQVRTLFCSCFHTKAAPRPAGPHTLSLLQAAV